jgi:hypothetical protein
MPVSEQETSLKKKTRKQDIFLINRFVDKSLEKALARTQII